MCIRDRRHVLARRHAGGNLHGDLALAPYPSFAAAVLARRLHDAPFAVACRARHHGNGLSEERPLSAADFTLTAARLTALLLGPGLGAGAFAMPARFQKLNGDFLTVSYTHLRAHETPEHLVCRLLLEK